MPDDVGFEIGGKVYPVPELGSFDMNEAQLLYDYAGVAIEDFALPDPDASREERDRHELEVADKVRNPAFKRALVEVAYRRAHPDMSWSAIRELIGGVNMVDVLAGFAEAESVEEGGDASPPGEGESTPQPSESSPSDSDASKPNSGPASPITSDEPADPLASIGATR